MDSKRKRSENWDCTYKLLLRQLVTEKISIIENKCVDTNTSKQKREAWKEVLESFNQASTAIRTVAQIQCQWRGNKMQAKACLSEHNKSQRATGGGPPPKSPNREDAELLALLPQKFAVDSNLFDCDADFGPAEYLVQEVEEPESEHFFGESVEEDEVCAVPEPQAKKRRAKNPAVTSEEMKIELFELTKELKMEILQLEVRNLEEENARREKEHTVRLQNLLRKGK